MEFKTLYTMFFSPTYTSYKGVKAIAKGLGAADTEIDAAPPDCKVKEDFKKDDFVIFGFPVYGGRIFEGALKRIEGIKGEDTPCIITVTYGNRDYDDALLELSDFVKARGFVPIAAAALIGQHTYGSVQVGRPNADDLEEDEKFGKKAAEKLKGLKDFSQLNELNIKGNRPYRDGGKGGAFRPSTNENCVSCGLCAKKCPMGAISFEDYKTIDKTKCIACFRCIKVCPKKAKVMSNPKYDAFAVDFSKRLAKRRENEYMI